VTNIYSITIHPDTPAKARAALVEIIQSHEMIENWWNHLSGLYLVITQANAAALARLIEPVLQPSSFLVMRVDLADCQGWMPERGWPWIMRRVHGAPKQDAEGALPEAVG
jgi:hypothetical protein